MASQKQGRSTTGQQASGRSSGSGSRASQPKSGGSSVAGQAGNGSANRGGRRQSGGSANRGGPGQSGRSANRSGRPGQSGQTSQPGKSGGGQAKGRDRQPGQPRAATLPAGSAFADAQVRRPPAPRWLRLTTLLLSLGGLGFSVYLTIAHYTSASLLLCPANSFINCGEVTSSPESIIFRVFPVAVLGLAFYVFMVAINSPWAWRSELPAIRWARLGGVITGIAFVLYLVYAELIEIGKICEYCTAVHIITFALFTLIVFDASFRTGVTGAAGRR